MQCSKWLSEKKPKAVKGTTYTRVKIICEFPQAQWIYILSYITHITCE